MEGMVALGCSDIQSDYMCILGLRGNADEWAAGLSTKLLECTHGQWLYRNVIVHDRDCGMIRSKRKAEILQEVECQLASEEQLSEEDRYLLEINVGDLYVTSLLEYPQCGANCSCTF